jgi:hypothetical protein
MRTRLELPPEIGGNCGQCGLRFCAASRSCFFVCYGFEQALEFRNDFWRRGRQGESSLRIDGALGQSGRDSLMFFGCHFQGRQPGVRACFLCRVGIFFEKDGGLIDLGAAFLSTI